MVIRLKLFRTITSVNQLSIYGAVSNLCEECKTCHVRTGRPFVAGPSDPLFAPSMMKTLHLRPMILRKKIYCKDTKNELKGSHNKIVWLNFVLMQDSWQQLKSDSTSWQKTLKNSHNSQIQWLVVSTLCQETKIHMNRKAESKENTKIGPVLEVTTCFLQGKYGVEIGIESINKDHSHSWVRISHGLNKMVTDLSNKEHDDKEQETSEMQFEDVALKTNVLAFASRSNAKAKRRRRTCAFSSTRTTPIGERTWTDIEPEDYSPVAYPVSKRLSTLLRHGNQVHREDDGAIEFWRINDNLQKYFPHCHHWSDSKWKKSMAGRGNKKIYQYCTDSSGIILYLRGLQGHSGRNLIDPPLQDNVLIPNDFLEYIITLDVQSIYTPSWIQDWYRDDKIWAKDRRYSFCLWILWIRNTKILRQSTWKHRVLHGICRQRVRNIKTRCIGSTSNLLKRKD